MGFASLAFQDLLLTAQRQRYDDLINFLSQDAIQRQNQIANLTMQQFGGPAEQKTQQNVMIDAQVQAIQYQIKMIEQRLEMYKALRQAVVTMTEDIRKALQKTIELSFKTFNSQ